MHQQVRTFTTKSRDDESALPEEGGLLDILSILKEFNLRSAGGTNLDQGGQFVFSVRHKPGDDTQDQRARDRLQDEGYKSAEVYTVTYCLVDDTEGALLRCIESKAAELKEPIVEVHVLTSERSGRVPVQLVTGPMLDRGKTSTA